MKKDRGTDWGQTAPYWEKHRDVIRTMFAPVTEALIAETKIVRGFHVLDLGTGPGEPAMTVAGLVGPEGRVLGVDPAPEMIAAAQRAATRQGVRNVTFEVASADHLSLASASFDAIVSRFAIMFFASPVEAVRTILPALKSGGRMAFAVWAPADHNPFHNIFSRVVERYVPPALPPPETSDAFRFAGSGKLLAVLAEAGTIQAAERVLQFRIEAPVPVEDFCDLRFEMSERLRTRLAALTPGTLEAVRNEIINELRLYSTGSGLSFPAEVLIVSGLKP